MNKIEMYFMGHLTPKKFSKLQERLDKAVQNAPESESLLKILKILFTTEEANYAYQLPLSFFTLEEAMKILKKNKIDCLAILNNLADKGFLFDFENSTTKAFFVAPPMPGFFEFALMRTNGNFDKKILCELFQ